MLVLKKIISWMFFLVLVFALLSATYIVYCWSHNNGTSTKILITSANDANAKIAVMKPDKANMSKVRIQRFLIKEMYKYPFYSPQYYSDYFFIDFEPNDSLTFVIDNKDTIRWKSLYTIDTVPSVIKGYNYIGELKVTYYQDTLFQSNIEKKPTVFILKQISLSPAERN